MDNARARLASRTLEDVYAGGWAVTIGDLWSGERLWAQVTGSTTGNPYWETWTLVGQLASREEIMGAPVNEYARAISDGRYADVWLCTDCTQAHANGEASPDRSAWMPEPLSLITKGELSLGMLDYRHASGCTPADREADRCGCTRETFSSVVCAGCGDSEYGDREAATIVYV